MHIPIGHDVQNTQSLTAQGVGILGPGGSHAPAEGGHNVVQFVRHGQDPAFVALGQFIAGKPGHVLFPDGLGHFLPFVVQEGIFLAHGALEFGEFRHHAGDQIRLGQEGSPFHGLGICFQASGFYQHVTQLLEPFRLVVHIPQAMLEGYFVEPFPVLGQGFLPVVVEEEHRIVQTGPEHPFIPVGHDVQMFLAAIPDGDELGHQFPIFVEHGEVPLVVPHGGDDGAVRQTQVLVIDMAAQGRGIFHQEGDFFQQVRRNGSFAPFGHSQVFDLFPDGFPPFVHIHHDEIVFHGLFVGSSVRDGDQMIAQEPMAPGLSAALHIVGFHRDHFVVQESHHPAEGTDETEVVISPPHGLGEVQRMEDIVQDSRQQFFRLFACQVFDGVHIAVLLDQVLYIHPLAPGKSLGGTGGIAILVKGDFQRRSLAFHIGVFLFFRYPFRQESHPAGSPVHFHRAEGDPGFGQLLPGQFPVFLQDAGHVLGRHFFRSDFI